MDVRLVTLLLLLAAAASAPLASPQLDLAFYKTTCPDAEKIIFNIVQNKFKEDPGTAAGLVRLVFHDCFANGCDASILIDPLSNQASEKEAGPNISVRGYDVIEEIKAELEKKCPGIVSCADIVAASARDAVKLTGGPTYEVPMGRRDSLESNRADADALPGPDIAVPKLIDEFSKQGFSIEEMVAMLAGGHSIGICRCFFIEADAAPIDPEFRKNITAACDGKDSGSVPMDFVSPNVFDSTYFALALAKKMPLTIDRLVGMDPKTEPVLKAMDAKPADFVPLFAKSMEKLSVLKVLTGKDGEIRKSCSEFNNPKASSDTSVIRISSFNPDQMGASQPGAAKPAVAEGRKVAPGGDDAAVKTMRNAVKLTKTFVNEAAAKLEGGVVINKAAQTETPKPNVVPTIEPPKPVVATVEPPKVVPVIPPPNIVAPPIGGEVKKEAGVQAAGKVSGTAATDKAAGIDESKLTAAGNKILGNEPASKLPGGEVKKDAGVQAAGQVSGTAATNKAADIDESKLTAAGNKILGDEPASKLPAGEVKKEAGVQAAGQVSGTAATNKAAGIDESKLTAAGNKILGDEPASKLPGGEQVATDRPAPKLRGGAQ